MILYIILYMILYMILYTILYIIIILYIISYYNILSYSISYYTILYYIMLYMTCTYDMYLACIIPLQDISSPGRQAAPKLPALQTRAVLSLEAETKRCPSPEKFTSHLKAPWVIFFHQPEDFLL